MVIAHYSGLKIAPNKSPEDSHPQDGLYFNFTISRQLKRLGHDYVVVNKDTPYLGEGRFAHHYRIMNALGRLKFYDLPIKVDLIFDRDTIPDYPGLPLVINSAKFLEVGNSKIRQAQLFTKLMPKTFIANSHQQAIDYLRRHNKKLLVAKPDNNSNGRGVQVIDDPTKLVVDDNHCRLPFVIQDFVESELGIPGLVTGRHDLRVYLLNAEPICISIRRPAPGKFLANTYQGGSIQFYPVRAIPTPVKKMCQQIDQTFTKVGPRYYSSDFMRDQTGRWWLIEINARPRIPVSKRANPQVKIAQKRIAFFLLRSAYHKQAIDRRLYKAFKRTGVERRLLRSSKKPSNATRVVYQGIEVKNLGKYRHNLATFKNSLPRLSRWAPTEIAPTLAAIYWDLANNNLLRLKLLTAAQTQTSELQPHLFQLTNQHLYGSLDRQLWQSSINTLLGKHPKAQQWRRQLHLKGKTELKQKPADEHKLRFIVNYLELDKLAQQMKASRFRTSSKFEILQSVLSNVCQLPGWRVVKQPNQVSASIAYANRQIIVPAQIESYSRRRIRKMAFHEIGIHLQRHMFTRLAPVKAFRLGLPGYEPFEEGLAVMLAGHLTKQRQSKGFMLYGALGLALGLDGQPRNYRQLQTLLEALIGLNYRPAYAKKQASVIVQRVFRGTDHQTPGVAFLADKKYLEGLALATDFINDCASEAEVVKLLRYRYNPLDENQRKLVDWLEANR